MEPQILHSNTSAYLFIFYKHFKMNLKLYSYTLYIHTYYELSITQHYLYFIKMYYK